MIDYIRGSIEYIGEDYVVVDNSNIGYKIQTSFYTLGQIKLHNDITIYTYLHVREDDMSLFGFLSREEIEVFKLLISVSGIGPKGALAIMSVFTVDELRMAVLTEDYKSISKANGVGPKTAQRLVVELKDKFKLVGTINIDDGYDDLSDYGTNDIITEAALALTSLGYSNLDAMKAIKKVKVDDNMSVEALIKAALKVIM